MEECGAGPAERERVRALCLLSRIEAMEQRPIGGRAEDDVIGGAPGKPAKRAEP